MCFFDCLHDMGDPVGALKHTRSTLADNGTCMLVEPFANERLEDNFNPVGRVYYAASTMVCTPASLDQEVGLALGAQAGETRLREVARQGGFTRFRRAAETPFNLILEARRKARFLEEIRHRPGGNLPLGGGGDVPTISDLVGWQTPLENSANSTRFGARSFREHPELKRGRKLFRLMSPTAHERCRLCYAGFDGFSAPVMRAIGRGQWLRNPHFCEKCELVLAEQRGGAEIEIAMLYADVRG